MNAPPLTLPACLPCLLAPAVDSRVVHGFRWLPVSSLLAHEEFIQQRHEDLLEYIESVRDQYTTVPAVVACSRSNVIIDGHHRTSVIQKLGFEFAPVVFLDYNHPDVHVGEGAHGERVSKQDVINAGVTGKKLTPKSTAHSISDGQGRHYPIICLSPICDLMQGQG
jgi:L-serine kinase (ADP)